MKVKEKCCRQNDFQKASHRSDAQIRESEDKQRQDNTASTSFRPEECAADDNHQFS